MATSTVFTEDVPLLKDYPAFDNHVKEAASWYQLGDLEKAGAYVRNITENLHANAGRGTSQMFLRQLVVHLVRAHPAVESDTPSGRAPDPEVVRLERRIAAYESATQQLFALVPEAKAARIDRDLTRSLDAANARTDEDATKTAVG